VTGRGTDCRHSARCTPEGAGRAAAPTAAPPAPASPAAEAPATCAAASPGPFSHMRAAPPTSGGGWPSRRSGGGCERRRAVASRGLGTGRSSAPLPFPAADVDEGVVAAAWPAARARASRAVGGAAGAIAERVEGRRGLSSRSLMVGGLVPPRRSRGMSENASHVVDDACAGRGVSGSRRLHG